MDPPSSGAARAVEPDARTTCHQCAAPLGRVVYRATAAMSEVHDVPHHRLRPALRKHDIDKKVEARRLPEGEEHPLESSPSSPLVPLPSSRHIPSPDTSRPPHPPRSAPSCASARTVVNTRHAVAGSSSEGRLGTATSAGGEVRGCATLRRRSARHARPSGSGRAPPILARVTSGMNTAGIGFSEGSGTRRVPTLGGNGGVKPSPDWGSTHPCQARSAAAAAPPQPGTTAGNPLEGSVPRSCGAQRSAPGGERQPQADTRGTDLESRDADRGVQTVSHPRAPRRPLERHDGRWTTNRADGRVATSQSAASAARGGDVRREFRAQWAVRPEPV